MSGGPLARRDRRALAAVLALAAAAVLAAVLAGAGSAGASQPTRPATSASHATIARATASLRIVASIRNRARTARLGRLRVYVRARPPASTVLRASMRRVLRGHRYGRAVPAVATRRVAAGRHTRGFELVLSATGRRMLRLCGVAMRVDVQAVGSVRRPRGVAFTGALRRDVHARAHTSRTYPAPRCRRGATSPGAGGSNGSEPRPGTTLPTGDRRFPGAGVYEVGLASRSINPGADGRFDGQTVFLGGYGLGGPPFFKGRPATGILGRGADVRAIAIGDGAHAIAIADEQTQGWFAKLKDGPYGLQDMRAAVARATGGGLPAEGVVIQSDHSHSGVDGMGVWGGIPLAYRRYIFDQTVAAIVDAWRTRRPAVLRYGVAPGRDLLSNQFASDPANQSVDSDVRVMQALDPVSGQTLATLLNFSAHGTVLGSDNTRVSGDWPQAANPLLQQRFGGAAITVVGTLGRTQPADRGCHDAAATGDAKSLCALDDYAGRVVDRTAQAVAAARPLPGPPVIAARSYLISDPATNPVLLGFEYAGSLVGTPLDRSFQPPWFAANLISTVTSSVRIGDVLLSAFPGEAYPQIALEVADRVSGLRGYMTAGLAEDQLGYLIAPLSAYPEPIRRTAFNQRGDQISPVDNDNYTFNVSMTLGQRVACSALRGAGELFGHGLAYRDGDPSCLPFANDLLLSHGADLGR